MKTRTERIRNAAFYIQLAVLSTVWAVCPILEHAGIKPSQSFENGCMFFNGVSVGLAGLVVLLLTLKPPEPRIQKVCFLLAGGGVTVLLVAGVVFSLLSWFGPAGSILTASDCGRGGITLPMILTMLLCVPAFVIGSVGAIVCLIIGKIRGKKGTP